MLRKQPNQTEVAAASMAARSRNKDTVDAILSAAIRILALEGYTRFTLRNIAKRVGLRLAAVQHYYPTKKEMLRAAIRGSIKQWDEPVSRLMLMPRRGAKSRLQAVIKLHLGSCIDDLTGGFFVALWALAAHDPDAMELLNDTYRVAVERFATLIMEANPALDAAEATLRAVQILSLLEGTTITAGPRKQYAATIRSLEKRLVQTALAIAHRE
jgi:AcrR family transcriptional regulator